MRFNRKKEHPRKEQQRHYKTSLNLPSRERKGSGEGPANGNAPGGKEEKPFKGMDIDRMNYTDI